MRNLFEEARRLIRINSVTSTGNEELANLVASLVQDRGLKTQLQPVMHSLEDVSKRQFNVIGILGDPLVDRKTRKGLLLCSHLDTPSPGLPENWTETGGDPFAATLKDGRLYGLGAAEGKLDFLCKLHAVSRFRERKLKMPVYLVGTCGEGRGMFGARYLIKSMALNPKYVAVGGPTGMKVVHAHKSLNLFRVSIGYQLVERDARGFNRRIDLHSFGRSAHGATPHLGVNAIFQATDFLRGAADNGFELRFTRLDGGDAPNKVPDRAQAEFYLTSHQFEDFKRFFRESVKAQGKERAFRVELGGLGDMGVRFLPDALFPCISEVTDFFRSLASEFEESRDRAYDPPYATASMGQLRQRLGGMDFHFDVRLLPEAPTDAFEKRINAGIQKIAAKYPNLNLSVLRERFNPAFAAAADSDLVRTSAEALHAAGLEPGFEKKSDSSEAAFFQQSGYESVVVGPGKLAGNSHCPNESVPVDELEKAIAFYERLIERVCT